MRSDESVARDIFELIVIVCVACGNREGYKILIRHLMAASQEMKVLLLKTLPPPESN